MENDCEGFTFRPAVADHNFCSRADRFQREASRRTLIRFGKTIAAIHVAVIVQIKGQAKRFKGVCMYFFPPVFRLRSPAEEFPCFRLVTAGGRTQSQDESSLQPHRNFNHPARRIKERITIMFLQENRWMGIWKDRLPERGRSHLVEVIFGTLRHEWPGCEYYNRAGKIDFVMKHIWHLLVKKYHLLYYFNNRSSRVWQVNKHECLRLRKLPARQVADTHDPPAILYGFGGRGESIFTNR
jgi:hypothetical protein